MVAGTRSLRSTRAKPPSPPLSHDDVKVKTPKKTAGAKAKVPVTTKIATPPSEPDVKSEVDDTDLPHGLGKLPDTPAPKAKKNPSKRTPIKRETPQKETPIKKQTPRKKTPMKRTPKRKADQIKSEDGDADDTPNKKARKAKDTTYGIMFGVSPWPDYVRPTLEDCTEVNRVLTKLHGRSAPPKKMPEPSDVVSGCGEVPSVLDAVIRTRLSANTTNTNSGRAMKGLIETFGKMQTGVGKGSCDWNKVRLAPQREVYEAIKSGGMADKKSKDIQAILNIVYQENQERRKALLNQKETPGSRHASKEEKDREVALAEDDVLSLNHLHLLGDAEIAERLRSLPGIGVKTASCVMLFSMHRPSFAVDTHVFRLVSWLGWIPDVDWVASQNQRLKKPDRDTAFAHLDVRIPNELKYSLHYLLIKHGKTCPRCRAITSSSSKGWEDGCVIEHLLRRTGARKGESGSTPVKKSKGKRDVTVSPSLSPSLPDASDDESVELSDLGSIDEPSEDEPEEDDE